MDPENATNEAGSEYLVGEDYRLTEIFEEELREHYPDVLMLINKLHRYIRKQQVKIKNLKLRLKDTRNYRSIAVQTDDEHDIPKNLCEEIKEAAEIAVQETGFVYEETSGLYYDYNSGYYYNAELGLYYDGNSGTYMTFNQETQTYEFHSQHDVPISATDTAVHRKVDSQHDAPVGAADTTIHLKLDTKPIKRKNNCKENSKGCKRESPAIVVAQNPDLEEGECSDSSRSDRSQDNDDETHESDLTEIARGWPPCMRIIVKSTSVPKMKEGSLYIITYQGGSLGREGDHSIVIPDINISKHHLKFTFDKESSHYSIIDLGSRNGTLLNGKRVSVAKQESDALEIVHGSHIQIGSTILLCHIHSGNETCGHCEPGLLQVTQDVKELLKVTRNETHKSELKKLRKKFGINHSNNDSTQLPEGYTDRAFIRRKTVGSLNENEKTDVASVDKSISSENKGFKLLSKMGWSEGQSLGKEGTGVLNPVELQSTIGTTGMGYKGGPSNSICKSTRETVLEKTQKRYQQLPLTENIFEDLE